MHNYHRQGPANPFLRLIQRHTNLATIMRVVQPAYSRSITLPVIDRVSDPGRGADGAGETLVKAFLMPTQLSSTEDLVTIPWARPGLMKTRTPQIQRSPAARRGVFKKPASRTLDSGTKSDDADWDRLQTIYRRHQEKKDSADAPGVEDEVAVKHMDQVQTSVKVSSTSPTVPPKTEPAHSKTPSQDGIVKEQLETDILDRSGAQESHSEGESTSPELFKSEFEKPNHPPPGDISRIQKQVGDETATSQVESGAGSEPQPGEQPVENASVDDEPRLPSQVEPGKIFKEQIGAPDPGHTSGSDHINRAVPEAPAAIKPLSPTQVQTKRAAEPRKGTIETDRALAQDAEPPASVESETQIHAPGHPQQNEPLQSVWSVQRLKSQSGRPPSEAGEPLISNLDSIPEEHEKESPSGSQGGHIQASKVEQILRQVAAGGPTDSSIEMVPPRKPQPTQSGAVQRAGSSISKEEHPQAFLDDTETPAQPSQQSVKKSAFTHENVPTGAHPQAGESYNGDIYQEKPSQLGSQDGKSDHLQRQGSRVEKPRSESLGDQMVHTEIGPMPSDLWRLIGQTPPSQSKTVEVASPGQRPLPTQEHSAHVMRTGGKQPSIPIAPFTYDAPEPPDLQRTAEMEQISSSEMSTKETTPTETVTDEAPESEGEVKVEQLARLVYAEIKHKLSIEAERIRCY
jgi:hypothetical protein